MHANILNNPFAKQTHLILWLSPYWKPCWRNTGDESGATVFLSVCTTALKQKGIKCTTFLCCVLQAKSYNKYKETCIPHQQAFPKNIYKKHLQNTMSPES
jgi:hypothetical protein